VKKYFTLFLQVLSQYSVYRGQVIVDILQSFITPGIMLLALSVATPTTAIDAGGLLSYYFLIALVYSVTDSKVDEQIADMAASGEVNNFFLKPMSFYRYLLFREIGAKTISLVIISPLLAVAILWLKFSLSNLVLAFLCLMVAFWLAFNLSYFVGLFSFWIDLFWAVSNIRHVIVQLFGGVVLPFLFFPAWLSAVVSFLPFPYMVSWPVKILTGQFLLADFLIAAFWSGILYLAARRLSAVAFNHYSFTAA
jgi:ABC-2 type transport system permease protein